MIASIARSLGWTMLEVRAHSLGDIMAMDELVQDEQRAKRMAAARRKAGL